MSLRSPLTGLAHLAAARRTLLVSRSVSSSANQKPPRVDVDQDRRLITISPADAPSHAASCIFMHGLGDTAQGWASLCHDFALQMPHVRFVCPTAPTQPVTLNSGMAMPSWYDIAGLEDRLQEMCAGIEDSRTSILELLEREEAAVGADRCVLAGFSQGGAMALYVGLQLPRTLGGILAMSAYLPSPRTIAVSAAARATPVLQCHGVVDAMVGLSIARKTEQFLALEGIGTRQFFEYENLGHAVNDEEIEDIRDWLLERLPNT